MFVVDVKEEKIQLRSKARNIIVVNKRLRFFLRSGEISGTIYRKKETQLIFFLFRAWVSNILGLPGLIGVHISFYQFNVIYAVYENIETIFRMKRYFN